MDFCFDHHVHTGRSLCGRPEMTPKTLANMMKQKNLNGFAITDHSPHFYFDSVDEAWETKSPDFFLKNPRVVERNQPKAEKNIREHIASIRPYAKDWIWVGLEADADFDSNVVVPPGVREELDILIGSVHWLPCTVEGDKSPSRYVREFLDITLKFLEQDIQVLAHPTRVFTWNGLEVPREVAKPVIEAAIAHDVALELNAHSQDPDEYFIRRCIEQGAKIACGTDAHSLEEFGDFSYHRRVFGQLRVSETELKELLFCPRKED